MSLETAWKTEEHSMDQKFNTDVEIKNFVAIKKPTFSDTEQKTKNLLHPQT